MMRWSFFFWMLISAVCTHAQNNKSNEARYASGVLRNNGWGVNYYWDKHYLRKHHWSYEADLVTHKHPKEVKIVNTATRNPSPYVFGKLNRIGLLRLNAGRSFGVANPDEHGNIGLSLSVAGGPTVAFLKPVYLDVYYPSPNGDGVLIPERYNPTIHQSQNDIIGYSDYRYGLSEIMFKPGLSLKFSTNLSWGLYGNSLKLFRTGCTVDFFPAGLEVMAFTSNPRRYLTFFVSFGLGTEHED
jgi:hypothetical protein